MLGLDERACVTADRRMLHRPAFYRPSLKADREALGELLEREPALMVYDDLLAQVGELVRALHPWANYTKPELLEAAKAHLGDTRAEDYGVWVHYPWSGRLVHLLDEREFAQVRTDRNRNKITREEQEHLSTQRIGVIGLSVGQSICLTLALERGFGELRIADFDTLDLSNLNRIRSGVHALGNLKTVNVAREIAEIDPFLKVTLFNEGLTRDNIDSFLTDGGKLDILVDECDGVDMKILCRQRAKALRIPVIMDTSDRGMLDIERFDLEPDRPILHGLIDHLDPEDAARAKTNEEKLPFVLPMAGMENLSTRMKASMLEIESTVTTWPQLASSVVMGGAVGAEFCRRIRLDQTRASGRWYIEPEKITNEHTNEASHRGSSHDDKPAALTTEQMISVAEQAMPTGAQERFTDEEIRMLVEAGAHAPSGGNLQPWNFLACEGHLFLFHDLERGYSAIDGGGLVPAIGLGACLENIRIAASSIGVGLNISTLPLPDAQELIAVISKDGSIKNIVPDPLAQWIPQRCTNRKKPIKRAIDDSVLRAMADAVAEVTRCEMHTVVDAEARAAIAEAIASAELVRVLSPIGHDEFFGHEVRWTTQEAEATRDGIDLATMELKPSARVAFKVASDPATMDLLRLWNGGSGFKYATRGSVTDSPALCLISTDRNDPGAMLDAGRAMERMWLAATAHNLAVHPVSAPILLAHNVRFGGGKGMNPAERDAVIRTFEEVRTRFKVGDREPMFLLRLCHAPPPTARSLRRSLEEVLHFYQVMHA